LTVVTITARNILVVNGCKDSATWQDVQEMHVRKAGGIIITLVPKIIIVDHDCKLLPLSNTTDIFSDITRVTWGGGIYQCIPGVQTLPIIVRVVLVIS
jgi:hypothetical protein